MRWRQPNAEPHSPGTSTTGAPAPATVTDTDSCGDTASCTTCDESPNNNTASSNIDPSSGRTPPRPRQRVPSHHVLRRGAVTGLTDRAAGGVNELWASELQRVRRAIDRREDPLPLPLGDHVPLHDVAHDARDQRVA